MGSVHDASSEVSWLAVSDDAEQAGGVRVHLVGV